MKDFRLVEYLQRGLFETQAELGGPAKPPLRPSGAPPLPDPWDGLMRVQQTNELYFKLYFGVLIVAFVATIVVAFCYRSEIGGLGAVLGVGGVVQGGVVLRLSAEWKEKARVDIVAALATALPAKDLAPVLKALLDGIRK